MMTYQKQRGFTEREESLTHLMVWFPNNTVRSGGGFHHNMKEHKSQQVYFSITETSPNFVGKVSGNIMTCHDSPREILVIFGNPLKVPLSSRLNHHDFNMQNCSERTFFARTLKILPSPSMVFPSIMILSRYVHAVFFLLSISLMKKNTENLKFLKLGPFQTFHVFFFLLGFFFPETDSSPLK